MRSLFWIAPLLIAAAALAQDKDSPEELIKRLGHEDYAVREQATQDLIDLGPAALPALEAALKSEDLEVRLRAGRAIRAIRTAKDRGEAAPEKSEADRPEANRPESNRAGGPRASRQVSRNIQIEMTPDGRVKVRQRVIEDGKETVKEYEGDSLEELKKRHPELRESLGGTSFHWRLGGFKDEEMKKLLKEFRSGFDDDFWKKWDDEWRSEMERIQRWREQALEQLQRGRRTWRNSRALPGARQLGLYAIRPDEVLDAQLALRGRGIVAERVEPASLAFKLGVQRHDILVRLNGREIKGPDDVRLAMAGYKQGAPLTATVIRRARPVELKLGD